jgi:hypothetical protein
MASTLTDNGIKGDILIIKELCKNLKFSKQKTNFYIDAAKHGVIAVESLLEQAIAKVGRLERCNKDGQDFKDGSDAKKAIVSPNLEVTIKNLKNKKGLLRIMIANPSPWAEILHGEKLYYFKVPHSAYADKQSINIRFNSSHARDVNVYKYKNNQITRAWKIWNKYRVYSFKELCE